MTGDFGEVGQPVSQTTGVLVIIHPTATAVQCILELQHRKRNVYNVHFAKKRSLGGTI